MPLASPNFVTVCDLLTLLSPKAPRFRDGCWWREGFNFRVSIHPTNGLVLHQLSYQDGDENRQRYRAALSEMVVPYGDTDPMHNWKHVFDAGEANIGSLTNSDLRLRLSRRNPLLRSQRCELERHGPHHRKCYLHA